MNESPNKAPSPPNSSPRIAYYDDGCAVYAVVGVMGMEATFRLFHEAKNKADAQDKAREWEHLPNGSLAWDAANQEIFRNFRKRQVTDPAEIALLPPLPTTIPTGGVAWSENFLPPNAIAANRFSAVALHVKSHQNQTGEAFAPLFLVLTEDWYESAMGDGVYRTLKAAFFNQARCASVKADSGETLTLATVWVGIVEDETGTQVFDLSRFKVPMFCHFKPEEVMKAAL